MEYIFISGVTGVVIGASLICCLKRSSSKPLREPSSTDVSLNGKIDSRASTWNQSLLIPAAAPGSKYATAYQPTDNQ